MLKPQQLFIIIYVNVCVKRVYPHTKKPPTKTITSCSAKKTNMKVNFSSHDRDHLRSLIVLSTEVINFSF